MIAPPTFGTICLVWNCGQVGERGLVAFQAITHALRPAGKSRGWARNAVELPRELRGGCSTVELSRMLAHGHHEPAIGFEPTTRDNPQTSAHQKRSGQEDDCGIARRAAVTPPRNAPRGGIEPPLPSPREPTIYGPLEITMDKWCRRYGASQAGIAPATPNSRSAALSR